MTIRRQTIEGIDMSFEGHARDHFRMPFIFRYDCNDSAKYSSSMVGKNYKEFYLIEIKEIYEKIKDHSKHKFIKECDCCDPPCFKVAQEDYKKLTPIKLDVPADWLLGSRTLYELYRCAFMKNRISDIKELELSSTFKSTEWAQETIKYGEIEIELSEKLQQAGIQYIKSVSF